MIADNAPVREATDLTHRLKNWTEPVILAGDFNAIPGMREHNLIAGQLARVPTTQPTYPADRPKLAVDHIYHSAAFQPLNSKTPPSKASDHRPLIVDLQPRPAESQPNQKQLGQSNWREGRSIRYSASPKARLTPATSRKGNRPEGAKVNSQGRKPLVDHHLNMTSPEGAADRQAQRLYHLGSKNGSGATNGPKLTTEN